MTRCDWAGCTRTDARRVDGWWHCPPHLREHYTLLDDERRTQDARPRRARGEVATKVMPVVASLVREGRTDREIADELFLSPITIRKIRARAGLASNLPARPDDSDLASCGTHAAFVRHKNRGETPCTDCRLGEREYQRARQQRRRAAAQNDRLTA